MSRSLKRILFILVGAVGLLVFVALAVPLFVDINRYKPRLEAAAGSNCFPCSARNSDCVGSS